MSKKSKQKSALKRRAERRKRKLAQVALYESWRDAGKNSKSKRAMQNAKRAKKYGNGGSVHHVNCLGDAHANPNLNMPFLIRMYELSCYGIKNQWTSSYPVAKLLQYVKQNLSKSEVPAVVWARAQAA